jgi:hypothetical protein
MSLSEQGIGYRQNLPGEFSHLGDSVASILPHETVCDKMPTKPLPVAPDPLHPALLLPVSDSIESMRIEFRGLAAFTGRIQLARLTAGDLVHTGASTRAPTALTERQFSQRGPLVEHARRSPSRGILCGRVRSKHAPVGSETSDPRIPFIGREQSHLVNTVTAGLPHQPPTHHPHHFDVGGWTSRVAAPRKRRNHRPHMHTCTHAYMLRAHMHTCTRAHVCVSLPILSARRQPRDQRGGRR